MENSTGENAQNAGEQSASTTESHMDVDATASILRKLTALSTGKAGGQREKFNFAKSLVLIFFSSQELFSAVLTACIMGLLQKSLMSAATKDLAQLLGMVGIQVCQGSIYRLPKHPEINTFSTLLTTSAPWELSFQVTLNHAKDFGSERDMRHSWDHSYYLTELQIHRGKPLALPKTLDHNLAHQCIVQISDICCNQHLSLESAIVGVLEDFS